MKNTLKSDPLIWGLLKFIVLNINFLIFIIPTFLFGFICYINTKDICLSIIISLLGFLVGFFIFMTADNTHWIKDIKKWINS